MPRRSLSVGLLSSAVRRSHCWRFRLAGYCFSRRYSPSACCYSTLRRICISSDLLDRAVLCTTRALAPSEQETLQSRRFDLIAVCTTPRFGLHSASSAQVSNDFYQARVQATSTIGRPSLSRLWISGYCCCFYYYRDYFSYIYNFYTRAYAIYWFTYWSRRSSLAAVRRRSSSVVFVIR